MMESMASFLGSGCRIYLVFTSVLSQVLMLVAGRFMIVGILTGFRFYEGCVIFDLFYMLLF